MQEDNYRQPRKLQGLQKYISISKAVTGRWQGGEWQQSLLHLHDKWPGRICPLSLLWDSGVCGRLTTSRRSSHCKLWLIKVCLSSAVARQGSPQPAFIMKVFKGPFTLLNAHWAKNNCPVHLPNPNCYMPGRTWAEEIPWNSIKCAPESSVTFPGNGWSHYEQASICFIVF